MLREEVFLISISAMPKPIKYVEDTVNMEDQQLEEFYKDILREY